MAKNAASLKETIDPDHLLQAIENSLEHSDETAHGLTGLHFKNYSILVHKRNGLSWLIECKFKGRERGATPQQRSRRGLQAKIDETDKTNPNREDMRTNRNEHLPS